MQIKFLIDKNVLILGGLNREISLYIAEGVCTDEQRVVTAFFSETAASKTASKSDVTIKQHKSRRLRAFKDTFSFYIDMAVSYSHGSHQGLKSLSDNGVLTSWKSKCHATLASLHNEHSEKLQYIVKFRY